MENNKDIDKEIKEQAHEALEDFLRQTREIEKKGYEKIKKIISDTDNDKLIKIRRDIDQ